MVAASTPATTTTTTTTTAADAESTASELLTPVAAAPLTSSAPPAGSIADTPSATAIPTPAAAAEPAGFVATIAEIDDALAARMASSWRTGCPVGLADLRYVTVTYRGFDGQDHPGELVVATSVAADVVTAFEQLHTAGFPIASMRLVDDFGASDDASMAADNTSAFNCRAVTGGSSYSEHSYGTAIDINPIENPYVQRDTVLPPAGSGYVARSESPGVIQAGDAVVTAFESIGWSWGGYWSSPTDYQHFSLSGR